MTGKVPLRDLCNKGVLTLITYNTHAEYSVLNQVLEALGDEESILIHSKPLRKSLESKVTLIDATAHALTTRSIVFHGHNDDDIHNPADTRKFLTQIQKKIKNDVPDSTYWIWWSPSDLVIQGVDDMEISRCLRIISKDFSNSKFIVLISKDVHTQQGLALIEYVPEIHLEVERKETEETKGYSWIVVKHPDITKEGAKYAL